MNNMRLPKVTKRYCPYCNKTTDQKIKLASSGSKKNSLSRGSKIRARLRGRNRGIGNLGRYSKPAGSKFKMKTKTTKKAKIVYFCNVCGKGKDKKKGIRAGKVLQE
jgi:ribosomal protein L44E